MLYLGIDIAKNNHVASLINENGKALFKAFSFANTSDGGEALLSKLNSFSSNNSNFTIGMEATGHYWLALYSFFMTWFTIYVINPIQTDGWRRN